MGALNVHLIWIESAFKQDLPACQHRSRCLPYRVFLRFLFGPWSELKRTLQHGKNEGNTSMVITRQGGMQEEYIEKEHLIINSEIAGITPV
jgi:hypothetical protein